MALLRTLTNTGPESYVYTRAGFRKVQTTVLVKKARVQFIVFVETARVQYIESTCAAHDVKRKQHNLQRIAIERRKLEYGKARAVRVGHENISLQRSICK